MSGYGGSRKTAEQLKMKANECFHRGKLGAAIDLYTEAYTLCPTWTVPLVNRALCWKRQKHWSRVIEDCTKVIEIDKLNLKAHYFLGVAHTSTGRFKVAVQNLEQALELARETEAGIKEEVWRALAKAKYELHSGSAAERAVQRGELLSNLKRLLKQEAGKKLQRSPKANVIIEQADQLERDIALLEDIFRNDEGRYEGDEVPSWCTCQLTLEVFHEPAVTPSGISYEQSTLLEHIQKVGEWDPVTRQPCKAKDIRKNIGLRNAVESYLNENPWAWYHAM